MVGDTPADAGAIGRVFRAHPASAPASQANGFAPGLPLKRFNATGTAVP
jgi:hypothetical protein